MRHGRAGDAASDEARQLTESGRRDVLAVARLVRDRGVTGCPVYTSPLIRARQTADLFAEEAGCGPVETVAALASGATLDDLLEVVAHLHRRPAALLVGHMPDFGVLAGYLSWQERGRVLDLPVGTIVAVHLEHLTPSPRAVLEWVVSPADAA